MNQAEQIKEAIRVMSARKIATIMGKVKTVNSSEATISVELAEEIIIEEVRLRATIDQDKGFYILPAIDSQVLMVRIGASDEFLAVGFSEFDKIIARNENVSIQITADSVIFNDNELGSFMPDLTKVVQKMNAIEQQINDLKTVLTNWVPSPWDGGATLKAASATWAGSQITQTTINDIKDPLIKN